MEERYDASGENKTFTGRVVGAPPRKRSKASLSIYAFHGICMTVGLVTLFNPGNSFFLENVVSTWCLTNALLVVSLLNVQMLVRFVAFNAKVERIQVNTSWALAYQVTAFAFTQAASVYPTLATFRISCTVIGTLSLLLTAQCNRTINSVMNQFLGSSKNDVVSLHGEEYKRRLGEKFKQLQHIKMYTLTGYSFSAVVFLGLGLNATIYSRSEFVLPILLLGESFLLFLVFIRVMMKGNKSN